MNLLYPRLLAIHDLAGNVGFPGPNGRLKLPRFMRASYAYMVAEGAYLICKSSSTLSKIWLTVRSEWRDCYDLARRRSQPSDSGRPLWSRECAGSRYSHRTSTRFLIAYYQTRLPKLPTLLSTQLRNVITHLERIIGHSLPVVIVRQNTDGMELEFANMLMEDSNNDALSYTDCE